MQAPKRKGISDKDISVEESGIVNANSLLHELLKDFAPFAEKDKKIIQLLKKYTSINGKKRKLQLKLKRRLFLRLEKLSKGKEVYYELLFTSLDGMKFMLSDTGAKNCDELGVIVQSYKDAFLDDFLGEDDDEIIIGDRAI